jgi:hypothetical protein
MPKRITTGDEYRTEFGESKLRERALQYALDIRKFEIELYWKRATYFWTLIAATFGGYFALAAHEKTGPVLLFLLSCIGLVLSIGWYLVNRGSKYWQSNWERHVDSLEDELMGPLYKTTISNEQFAWLHFWGGYPYSVSRVNQLISLFVVSVWFGLAISSFPGGILPFWITRAGPWILAATTVLFIILLLTLGRGGSQGEARRVDFHRNELVPFDHDRRR